MDGADSDCPITVDTPKEPVYIQGTNAVFEFEALQRHYVDYGTNPLTNMKLSWKNVRRCCRSNRSKTNRIHF